MADGSRLCSVLGAFDGSAFDGSFIAASNSARYSACIHGDGQVKIRINAININSILSHSTHHSHSLLLRYGEN